MDPQAATKLRYDRLKQALADEKKVRKKARRARIFGLMVVGGWLLAPALFWDVDLESAARPEFFRRPTPHEAYLLELIKGGPEGAAGSGGSGVIPGSSGTPGNTESAPSALAKAWEAAANRSIDFPLVMGGAYQEIGIFPFDKPQALGLRVHMVEGQRLRLKVEVEGESDRWVERQSKDSRRLFLDFFRAAPDTLLREDPNNLIRPVPVENVELSSGGWRFDATRPGDFVLRLQPELVGSGRFRVTIQVGAPWVFPVAGAGESDIGGVFGDPRDGGGRDHHGVDIFKPRGTPVLAAADGRVTSVDTTEIGGRVVWQREADGRHSMYYAHLDRPLVQEGQSLRAGDTVGLVGNTGNARATPPHLHFGAYRRGAVDPWDLILPPPPEVPVVTVALDALGEEGRVIEGGALLRRSPSARGGVVADLGEGTPIRAFAGVSDWYRVVLPGGESGFLTERSLVIATPNGTRPSNTQ